MMSPLAHPPTMLLGSLELMAKLSRGNGDAKICSGLEGSFRFQVMTACPAGASANGELLFPPVQMIATAPCDL